MAKMRGKLQKNDLEGGHWQLVAEDGETYVLAGDAVKDADQLGDGAPVEVDGSVDRAALSFAMTGPTLKVKAIKKA